MVSKIATLFEHVPYVQGASLSFFDYKTIPSIY